MRKSKGQLEREDTAYVFMRVGNSLLICLDGTCKKFKRKHGHIIGTQKHYRSRFFKNGVPFDYTMVESNGSK